MDEESYAQDGGNDTPQYEKLLQLEDLESLLEELEEGGWETDFDKAALPGEMLGRINAAQISTLMELKGKIARLHATLDSEDQDSN